jgi:hypothetical protein
MDEAFANQLRREWHYAQREGREATHWLMTNERRDRLRYEHKGQAVYATDQPESYMGLRIYVTDELDPPGYMLREGEPPDYLREAELRQQLAKIQRAYQDQVRPIVDELAKLEARKPLRPLLFPSTIGGTVAPR